MLRELIAWVLNNYLGKYVHNLNTAQLSVALLSGEVELENLPLRRDALRNLGLPLQALNGVVGKIKLQIPVRQFRTAPWCIYIENVFVVIGPINLDDWDADAEEQADLDYKLARLDALEAKWRAEREAAIEGGYYATSYSGWLSYGTSLVTNIVENLELKIKNVHIRYEDTVTIPNYRFSFGLTIDSLQARSCDSNWIAGYMAAWNQTTASFKLVELTDMSIYWQPLHDNEALGDVGHEQLADEFDRWKAISKQYIINPVSATAKFKRDRSETPLRTRSRPRLTCDLILNEVLLTLNDWQYKEMVDCIRGLDNIARCRRYRLLRPEHSVHEAPKAWWIYAIRCHGININSHRHQHRDVTKDNFRYIEIYTRLVDNPNETLSHEQKDLKDKVEKERTYDELKLLREICMFRIPNKEVDAVTANQGRSMLLQWFPQWWGWYKTDNLPTTDAQNNSSTVPLIESPTAPPKDQNQLEDEFLNALTLSSTENNSLLKRDAVFGKFNFTLKKGSLDICTGTSNGTSKLMLQLQFQSLLLDIESRPRSGSHFVGLSLGSVLLKDLITNESEFPDLIKSQVKDDASQLNNRTQTQRSRLSMGLGLTANPTTVPTNFEPLFQMHYERKPLSYNTDYRLLIKSQSLDIVYNMDAIQWILDFLIKPHQIHSTKKKIEAMKNKTKAEFIKNWENILEGDLSQRKTWTLEIDISAPQIIFVENFKIRNCSIIIIDFGRLKITNITNGPPKHESVSEKLNREPSEDEEMFLTPCETPPGSQVSSDSPTLCSAISEIPESIINMDDDGTVNEKSLHDKIYDRYKMDLTDMQVLVCKTNERWQFASSKGSSSLHVLDRFSITLEVERRIVFTNDPQFPSLTISGTLPKLVAHVNEQKIEAIINMAYTITAVSIQSSYRPTLDFDELGTPDAQSDSVDSGTGDQSTMENPVDDNPMGLCDSSKLFVLQFSIDQMSLEVQSRSRCLAELQVSGVKAGFSKRPEDISLSLSVHGLLLVDAIQSFGPDFELLIASHRHVGMDSISGSLKQSEPCSPNSPSGSPDSIRRPTSPTSISRALHKLQRTNSDNWFTTHDTDALITVEVLLVTPGVYGGDHLQIASIQFNNLDIIANQETIVELLSFANRVFPKKTVDKAYQKASMSAPTTSFSDLSTPLNCGQTSSENTNKKTSTVRTEITFDFHRLSVLVLRAVMRDSFLVGRKVATFTMSEAKIHATLGADIVVEGSLGGLQVIDLTPEGVAHQRILSVGKDPLTEPPNLTSHHLVSSLTQEVYGMGQPKNDFLLEVQQALSFHVSRSLTSSVNIKIRMASVWYIHCARFMQEISWCATEFKHYLKNLAKSIREKATDMALGLVQPTRDLTATTSKHVDSPKFTPRSGIKRQMTASSTKPIKITMDVVLDTPVLVLPRSSCSSQVFVAHLGKISFNNLEPAEQIQNSTPIANHIFSIEEETLLDGEQYHSYNAYMSEENLYDDEEAEGKLSETYILDVRNMNVFSLDTVHRKGFRLSALPRADDFYSCKEDAVPVLHDTAIHLSFTRTFDNPSIDLLSNIGEESIEILKVTGSVVKPLTLSLSRREYEQLLETTENLFKVPADLIRPPANVSTTSRSFASSQSSDPDQHDADVLGGNKRTKRRLFSTSIGNEKITHVEPKVSFKLPIFVIQLKNELNDPLIEILFREFNVYYEKNNIYETNIQVSLRSLLMEDLLQPSDSKHRCMLVSSSPEAHNPRPGSSYSSRSCPNLIGFHTAGDQISGSLPENLAGGMGFESMMNESLPSQSNFYHYLVPEKSFCPDTPPPSPQRRTRQDNLVLYSALLVDPESPHFISQYNSMQQTSSIDFNSLDFVVSVQSWFALLNFFGLISESDDHIMTLDEPVEQDGPNTSATTTKDKSELEISVHSLTVVFVRADYEIAKANVSNAHFVVTKHDDSKMVKGRLGSVSLYDLTSHGSLYRERFITSGNEALNFVYTRDESKNPYFRREQSLKPEATLNIKMASVRYVHTKRFLGEIQCFVNEFQQLQTPILFRKIKHSESRSNLSQKRTQLALSIKAGSPIILLPLSAKSNKVIIVDLGEFSLQNSFHLSSESDQVISKRKDDTGPIEILDVMLVELVNTNLFAGQRYTKGDYNCDGVDVISKDPLCMDMGSYIINKHGVNLLRSKCHLKLIVERNLDLRTHNVPDFSVQGMLSRLEVEMNSDQYKLVRGFLAFNLGENIDDLNMPLHNIMESRVSLLTESAPRQDDDQSVWISMSITLDLQDVLLRLLVPSEDNSLLIESRSIQEVFGERDSELPLACIKFIKSSLKIDIFSDNSQDIDLVSEEILVNDSRFGEPSNETCTSDKRTRNVFTNILQPISATPGNETVQAEVHTRKRDDYAKYTILLNNMRVMAILDWMENVRDFLSQDCSEQLDSIAVQQAASKNQLASSATNYELEVILNITNSELVFVEKTDQWDSNAVILKSTTVLSFRPAKVNKVMSINLNHLEVFSCTLGFEEETALSIIDPITLNMDLKENVLDVQMQKRLCIRLSYNDLKMFVQMFESLPNQTKTAQTRENQPSNMELINKLSTLGFSMSDCAKALDVCNNVLDDSALWLTQNAEPSRSNALSTRSPLDIRAVEIRANCISICVIDDCKDADVPLLEVSFSDLQARQEIGALGEFQPIELGQSTVSGFKAGSVKGHFASDYYNRALSGWEPIVEPWKCEADWNYSFGTTDQTNRLQLKICSDELLRLNITTTLIELFNLVYKNWSQDYFSAATKSLINDTGIGYRRRNPFVPFALKNETGVKLRFTTFISGPGTGLDVSDASDVSDSSASQQQRVEEQHWKFVDPGTTVPFSFGPPHKKRHYDSHKLNLHQIRVEVDGWSEVGPVSVDRVGVFFRYATHELTQFGTIPTTRIVFSITLEGSAQKLITVRSALRVINQLDKTMLLKMEHLHTVNLTQAITAILTPNESYCVPLSHVNAHLFVVPVNTNVTFNTETPRPSIAEHGRFNSSEFWRKFDTIDSKMPFCERSIHWRDMRDTVEVQQWYRICKINRDKVFRLVAAIRRDNYPMKDVGNIPGHTITLLPPLRLHNLLPCDLLYKVPNEAEGRVSASETANVYDVDLENQIEISLALESYPGSEKITIPAGHIGVVEYRLRLTDTQKRPLIVKANIQMIRGSALQITISASYWLVNKTGLPIIFRQEGASIDSSGQFSENEEARLVSPLIFSFTDPDAPPSMTVRLGKRYGVNPPWCQPFSLNKDISHLQLRSGSSNETFIIGTEIRCGRGRYAKTKVVTFAPRFQLYNRSTYKLQFVQKCYATPLPDPMTRTAIIEAVPDCHLPFHWPRLDKSQELCVRLPEVESCLWSGGIPINEPQSLYINIRNINGEMFFLRLEIVLQGATYFLLFGNAQTLPPPIRIDNYADVSMKFYQPGCKHQWQTSVRPHSSIAYALDEPMGTASIVVEAPGGVSHNYSLGDLGLCYNLTYENFIYIAFSGTFRNSDNLGNRDWSEYDMDCQELVLTVAEDRVYLARKQQGNRAQLWRMNQDKQLEHEGSSPPTEPGKKPSFTTPRLVLDLEKAPQPMHDIPLVVRPANKQRRSTQTWYFTEEGRLMCEHSNMCVQARGGVFGLQPGGEAVLGMIVSDSHVVTESLVPIEQAIRRDKLRPGSGFLSVSVCMDGPIKTIQIKDIKATEVIPITLDPTWKHVSNMLSSQHIMASMASPTSNAIQRTSFQNASREYHVVLKITKGIGVSVVSKQPNEEIAFVSLEDIALEMIAMRSVHSLDLSVADMQVDNQLFESQCPVALFTPKTNESPKRQRLPALHLNVKLLPSPNASAVIFEHCILNLRPVSIYLEERLILRMAMFMGVGRLQNESMLDESDYEAHQVATKILAANAKRYYFGDLKIVPSQIRLSVVTASKLSNQLLEMKKCLGLTLIKFEDAVIEFEKFSDRHHFETLEVYLRAIKSHYKQQFKWQAAFILGSVDFLGNPLGFASDLSEGVSGLIFEGSVKSLVKNVTHGISNSTAKITETLSDGLGRVVLDEQDTETRQRILEVPNGSNSTGDHLVAGIKGFSFGLLGGVTSIVKHTYIGAQNDGIQGFISGLGKGIVGTVTKPVIGVLDLASETANAVRETSKSSNRLLPERKRLPRCVTGAPGGLLPTYSFVQSRGQQHLFLINKRNFSEQFMAYEPCLFDGRDSKLRLLVSSENLWIFSRTDESTTIILSYHFSELVSCHPVSVNNSINEANKAKRAQQQHYIELCLQLPDGEKKPRVRCLNEEMSQKASRHINYAKSVYDERKYTINFETVIDM